MKKYRIVLADDHNILRQGLKSLVEGAGWVSVVAEARDGIELLDVLKNTQTDMAVVDIAMPKLRGIEAAAEVKSIYPHVKILILSMHSDADFVRHAFSAGADGYLLKEDTGAELLNAIQTVRIGRSYLSKRLSTVLAEELGRTLTGGRSPAEVLTTREREVLKLIAEGKRSKEIGALLCISPRTVDHHRARIMSKLNLKGLAELVRYAVRKGYISKTSPDISRL